MKSTGNDLVALGSLNKQRTREFRFYSKILSAPEQALYHQQFAALPFENYVWLLWSIKESAYKYLKRASPCLAFSPVKITVQQIKTPPGLLTTKFKSMQWQNTEYVGDLFSGIVIFETHILFFRSKISKEWITTVVNDNESFDNVCWGVQSIDSNTYDYQSKAARIILLKKLNPFFPGNLKIGKSAVGYPVVLKDTQDLQIPVSLAHHDHFVGYSFLSSTTL